MEVVGGFDHPHLVRATDAGESAGLPFLVMEYVEGLDVRTVLRRASPLPVADACEIVAQAALGLQYIHERGLVHRDVKPANLLLSQGGLVKVVDLGLARLHHTLADELTTSNQVMGTADYMAPEQARDAHGVDIRADVYSLGCTLYALLTGGPPFSSPDYHSLMRKLTAHEREPAPSIQNRRPGLPEGLAAVVHRMLAKAPAERYATPGEVAEALRPFRTGANLLELLARARAQAATVADFPGRTPVDESDSLGPLQAVELFPETGPSVATVPEGRPRSLSLRAAALLGGLLLLGLLVPSLLPSPDPAGRREPKLTPDAWHDVLKRPPTLLRWPAPGGQGHWEYRPAERELRVDCSEVALFRLGTTHADNFQFAVTLHQTNWTGGLGLFLGGREDTHHGRPCRAYQVVELNWGRDKKPADAFDLYRSRLWVDPDGNVLEHSVRTSLRVPEPGLPDPRLEVVVRGGMVETILWAGRPWPGLIESQFNDFTARESRGDFGTYSQASSGVFRDAQYRFQKEPNDE
jgi:hypothetical protein